MPLAVITMMDAVAGVAVVRLAAAFGILLGPSVSGILSVLVFGAGTNYALLLIARYRDELRLVEDRRHAMSRALRGAGPTILASGSTVAKFFASEEKAVQGVWFNLGMGVARRPVIVIGVPVLGGLARGAIQIQLGMSQTERFVSVPESVRGAGGIRFRGGECEHHRDGWHNHTNRRRAHGRVRLGVVFLVLILFMRALLAPVLLLRTVIASYFSSPGANWLLFTNVFHFPAIDTSVILLNFLFVMALGG